MGAGLFEGLLQDGLLDELLRKAVGGNLPPHGGLWLGPFVDEARHLSKNELATTPAVGDLITPAPYAQPTGKTY